MNALVFVKDDAVRASSRDVATAFEKNHRDVLRSIDVMIEQEPLLRQRNFALTFYEVAGPNGAVRSAKCYEMDRDGFALLAMGFTGAKALRWKLAYIDAFNRMEAALREGAANDDAPMIDGSPDGFERIKTSLAMVREARCTFGRAAAKRAWQLAGLPDVSPTPELAFDRAVSGLAPPGVERWFGERVELAEPHVRTGMLELYADYGAWARETGEEAVSLTAFGRGLSAIGVPKGRSDVTYRKGVRLRG